MAEKFIAAFDGGIGKILDGIINDGPGKVAGWLGRAANGIMEGAAAVHDGVVAGVGSVISGGMDLIPSLPSRAEAPIQEAAVKIEPPARAVCAHEVDMHDVGQFSAPTFCGPAVAQNIGQGAGRG